MRRSRKPPPAATTPPAPAPEPRLADQVWVRLLLALWVIGLTAYYFSVQLAPLVQVIR